MYRPLVHLVRQVLSAAGYTIRDTGDGVSGIDLLHDAKVLLNGTASPVLFDVGANVGEMAIAMLQAFPAARIVAFEPSPNTVKLLERNLATRSNVTVEAMAMGAAPGVLPFHVTGDHSVNDSLLKPTWSDQNASVVNVEVQTVDGYCEALRIETVDLLKIDAQGYDARVLAGAKTMLRERRIRLYSCEANFHHMYEGQASMRDLLEFAEQVGYDLVGCYEQSYIKNSLSYLDMLFSVRQR